jgi:hypothetical protein
MVEWAGREEGRAIVKPSKRFGLNYIVTRIHILPREREKGKGISISPKERSGLEDGRTPLGIRTAQSSRFESFSTLFQLNFSFSRVSVKGWKPFGVGSGGVGSGGVGSGGVGSGGVGSVLTTTKSQKVWSG